MVTLLPIEPRNEQHGMLIVEAFSRLFINRGGQSDGWGNGYGNGYGYGNGDGNGNGYGWGDGDGDGGGGDGGNGWGSKCPEEWRVGP